MTDKQTERRDELIKMPCTCSPVPEPNWENGTMCERCHELSLIQPPDVTGIDD